MLKPSKAEPARYTAQFDGPLLEEIEAFRDAQPVPLTQSETLRFLVRTGVRALRERSPAAQGSAVHEVR